MEYRTTTRQNAIWILLKAAEMEHIKEELAETPDKATVASLEAKIVRLKTALALTEIGQEKKLQEDG